MPADGNQRLTASRSQPCGSPERSPLRFSCADCLTPTALNGLNDNMLCESCGEPEEDPDDFAPSADELMRTECSWAV